MMASDIVIQKDERMNGASTFKQEETSEPEDARSRVRQRRLRRHNWWQAYGATLVAMGIVVHIVASVVTIVLYFLFSSSSGVPLYPIWYAPVFGALATYVIFSIIAAFTCSYIATVETANKRSYGLLKTRLCQLKARIEGIEQHVTQIKLKMEYRQIALKEAHACYDYIDHYLRTHRTGMQWVTGIGYINMWGTLHRAEEALIKVEPPEMVLRGAMHDKLAIQNSTIGNRDELLEKLVQAASDIEPVSAVYFKEHQSEPHNDVLRRLVAAVNKLETTDPKIVWEAGEDDKDQDDHVAAVHASARMAVSEVRRTLNDFRDGLWEGLVRERNQLLTAMSVTALVTHLLLCVTILTGRPGTSVLLGATAFYMVGAIAGLFGRFYNEANKSSCIDDYGLSQARLLATPLLSGLAGVGGVLITIIFYTTLLMPAISNSASSNVSTNTSKIVDTTQAVQITMEDIFRPDEPSYLLTAAVFGLAPNLIISSLQQRTQKYTSDLQKSKSGGKDERDS
jgi:hypothetical protein